jgi:ribosome-binding protein aMBF1 (putative translation factor)
MDSEIQDQGGAQEAGRSSLHEVFCRVCGGKVNEVRNINLYVIGSEGLNVCHDCEMQLVEAARAMIRTATKCRMIGYKAAKSVAEAKRQNDQALRPAEETTKQP